MPSPIAEATALLGDRPHALAKAGIISPGRPISHVIRQRSMAYTPAVAHPECSRRWTTASASRGRHHSSRKILQRACPAWHRPAAAQPRVGLQHPQPLASETSIPPNGLHYRAGVADAGLRHRSATETPASALKKPPLPFFPVGARNFAGLGKLSLKKMVAAARRKPCTVLSILSA